MALLVPASASATVLRTQKSTLARENECVSQSPKLPLKAWSQMSARGFKVCLQGNWERALIKASFRCEDAAEIDVCAAINRGIPGVLLIWSKAASPEKRTSAGGWEEDFQRGFKEFYGQGRRGDCLLDLQGVKLFLLPSLSFFSSPIRGVRKQ